MGAGIRKIIHVDMDAFYASVEQHDRPELRGKCVIVGGSPEGRGVVCSASYEARKFGVRSAMSSAKAARLCPRAVFVRPTFSRYKEVSGQIREIFLAVTDRVEPLALDEAYLDVTENHLGEPLASRIAATIRAQIREKTGLTASAGVGPNKFIAKLASDLRKPDALVVVPPEKVAAFVADLPVEKLWGVGPATALRLQRLGLASTAHLRNCPPAYLEKILGGFGNFLYRLAHGEDDRPVLSDRRPRSRGSETTFHQDLKDPAALKEVLRELSEDVSSSLRRIETRGQTITLKVRFRDFKTVTRSRTLPAAVNDSATIAEVGETLLSGLDIQRVPVRLLGLSVSKLIFEEDPTQLTLPL